jgi:hypothetical protein
MKQNKKRIIKNTNVLERQEKLDILYNQLDLINEELLNIYPNFKKQIEINSVHYGKYNVECVFLKCLLSKTISLNEFRLNDIGSYVFKEIEKMPESWLLRLKEEGISEESLLFSYYVPTKRINENWFENNKENNIKMEYSGELKTLPICFNDFDLNKVYNFEDTKKIIEEIKNYKKIKK